MQREFVEKSLVSFPDTTRDKKGKTNSQKRIGWKCGESSRTRERAIRRHTGANEHAQHFPLNRLVKRGMPYVWVGSVRRYLLSQVLDWLKSDQQKQRIEENHRDLARHYIFTRRAIKSVCEMAYYANRKGPVLSTHCEHIKGESVGQ